jgi:23S rRNA (uracil1939-C5)-methyltransferase
VEHLRAAHPEVVGIVHAVNGGSAELSAGLESTTLWGRPYLLEQVTGLTLKISLNAFFQTNTLMAHVLYGLAAREAGIGDSDAGVDPGPEAKPDVGAADGGPAARRPVVWDLYSGVGSIGLSLARGAAGVLGIEAVPSAVHDAEENARLNGITNARFVIGDVRRVLREVAQGSRTLPRGMEKPDVIVVDPPRAGLHRRVVDRIGETKAPRIVYVSCNPSTMAPNVAQLQGYGYRLERVTPIDMFPHTPHVECVGLLTLSTAADPGTSLPSS